MKSLWLFVIAFTGQTVALWNDLNCPAPRSPENGLSFIFRNGELVHFRCHPSYVMHGKSVAYCVNSQWTAQAPECIPLQKGHKKDKENLENKHDAYYGNNYHNQLRTQRDNRNMTLSERREELNSKLFNWDNRHKKKGVYGDGPRRLPLINGIWPSQPVQIMELGPQSTPGPLQMVKEEVNIAELRQKQYEEVAKHRLSNPNLDLLPAKKRKGNKRRGMKKKYKNSIISSNDVKENASRETVISLGKTEDGDALSIAFARPTNDSNEIKNNVNRHKYRHHDPSKKKRKGKRMQNPHVYTSNIMARSSRVDTSGLAPYRYQNKPNFGMNEVAELRRRPVQNVRDEKQFENKKAQYDTSCVESFYGRDLPMMAPQVPNAFVYRYETKKNKDFPFNSYMQVKYRCLSGYSFADVRAQVLNCREAKWIGDLPNCIEN